MQIRLSRDQASKSIHFKSLDMFGSEIFSTDWSNHNKQKGKGEGSHKKFVLNCRTSDPFSRNLKISTLYFRWYLCTILKIFIYLFIRSK